MDLGRYVRSGWWGTFALRWDAETLIMQYLIPRGSRGIYVIFPTEETRWTPPIHRPPI